jgi:hypothetical protein
LRKRIIGYLVRNAKLIHELKGTSRSTRFRSRPLAWWVALRMNESTNSTPRKGQYHREVLNQFIFAKAGISGVF